MNKLDQFLKEKRKIAKNSPKGPWFSHSCMAGKNTECWCKVVGTSPNPSDDNMDSIIGAGSASIRVADFIAAFNPSEALKLLEIIEIQQNALKSLVGHEPFNHTHEPRKVSEALAKVEAALKKT